MGAIEETEERLYGLAPEEFTAARDDAAKSLRAEGDRDAAAAVGKLRKPSAAAAAVNRAVRAEPKAAKTLVATGERLEAAQAEAISGSAGGLREAADAHAEAIAAIVAVVEAELGKDAKPAIIDRARETFRAVAADAELRRRFERGVVVREAEAVGFGTTAATPAPTGRRSRARDAKPSAAQRKRAERAVAQAQRALEAATAEVEGLGARAQRARRALTDAEAQLAEAEAERADRESELGQARQAARELGAG